MTHTHLRMCNVGKQSAVTVCGMFGRLDQIEWAARGKETCRLCNYQMSRNADRAERIFGRRDGE